MYMQYAIVFFFLLNGSHTLPTFAETIDRMSNSFDPDETPNLASTQDPNFLHLWRHLWRHLERHLWKVTLWRSKQCHPLHYWSLLNWQNLRLQPQCNRFCQFNNDQYCNQIATRKSKFRRNCQTVNLIEITLITAELLFKIFFLVFVCS